MPDDSGDDVSGSCEWGERREERGHADNLDVGLGVNYARNIGEEGGDPFDIFVCRSSCASFENGSALFVLGRRRSGTGAGQDHPIVQVLVLGILPLVYHIKTINRVLCSRGPTFAQKP